MLYEYPRKVKNWIQDNQGDLYIAVLIFLVGLASFGLGRLSVIWPEKEPIRITKNLESRIENIEDARPTDNADIAPPNSKFQNSDGKYVASKNGTAYHFPWCPGALRIKEENKIWFETKAEAEKAGYRPAANCEGL